VTDSNSTSVNSYFRY